VTSTTSCPRIAPTVSVVRALADHVRIHTQHHLAAAQQRILADLRSTLLP